MDTPLFSRRAFVRSFQPRALVFSRKVAPQLHPAVRPATFHPANGGRCASKATSTAADQRDSLNQQGALFMLQTHFHRSLSPMFGHSSHATQKRRPAGDRFPVVVGVLKPRVEMPPVANQGDHVGHQLAWADRLRGEAVPLPLIFEFVVDLFSVGSLSIQPGQGFGWIGMRIEGGNQHRDPPRPRGRSSRPSFSTGHRVR